MPTLARTRHRPRGLLLAGGTLTVLSVALVFSQTRLFEGDALRGAGAAVTMPVVRAGTNAREGASTVWVGMFEAKRLKQENDALRAEIAQLRVDRAQAEARAAEQEQAGLLAKGLPEFGPKSRPAPVLAPLLEGGAHRLWIGIGSADGIAEGMAVLGPAGVLGVVRKTFDHQAVVQLTTDRDSRWGGEVRVRGELGVVCGTGESGRLELRLEKTTTEIQPGDVVETSGTRGSLAPPGLPIGTVEKIEVGKSGERQAVLAVPGGASDLRTVFVLDARQIAWEPPK